MIIVACAFALAIMNQQPPMHQLAILSIEWDVFFHLAPYGVHHSPFFFAINHYTFFNFFLVVGHFSPWPNLTHSYLVEFPTFINTAPTLVPYLLSLIDLATLIASYPIDLIIKLTTYLTNLVILLITYPTNLTILLTTYSIDLVILHTQPPYWHKYFKNLITLTR